MNNDTKVIANQKVDKALRLIEQAQFLLSQACGELSSICWADKQWSMVGRHYDETKALWHRVNGTVPRSKIDLDSDAKRALQDQEKTK
jgi:hypothetical protein